MKLFILSVIIGSSLSITLADELRLDNLEPSEAQKYIESKDQSLKYAPKIETNVPAVRVLGKTPTHVLEDIYLANQYHGQDGLGGYLYGYAVPDIAKTEKKKPDGDLTGAYNYVNGDGQEIKVQYWDRGDGFHQIDNVPKILPKQIDDLPEVKAAKAEHLRIWQEEAERNSRPVTDPNAVTPQQYSQYQPQYQPQPQPQYQQGQYNSGQYQPQPQQSQYQPQTVAAQYGSQGQHQAQAQSGQNQQPQPGQYQQPQPGQYQQPQPGQYQQPQPGQYQQSQQGQYQQPQPGQYQQHQPGQYQQPQYQPPSNLNSNAIDYSGQYSSNAQTYAASPNKPKEWEYKASEEESGPPRGFFYSYDYPVGIIVSKQGGVQKRESLSELYTQNKAAFDLQLKNGSGQSGGTYPSYQVHAA